MGVRDAKQNVNVSQPHETTSYKAGYSYANGDSNHTEIDLNPYRSAKK
jgi:hypothetical protein